MTEKKTFCIILCVSDALDFFEPQIRSIAQSDEKVFFVISLDCFNDASIPRIKEIVSRYFNDDEVIYYQGPKKGFMANFMFASRQALSLGPFDYYAFCDQDDIWKKTKLSRAKNAISSVSASPELYSSSTLLIDENDKPIHPHKTRPVDTFATSLVENVSPGNAMVFNSAAIEQLTKLDEHDVMYHEWWLFILTQQNGKAVFDTETQVLYRQHAQNTIGSGGGWKNKVLSSFRRSRYYDSISRNIEAILRNELPLSSENQKTLSHFSKIYSLKPFQRLLGLWLSGVRRSNMPDTVFFYLLVLLAPGLKEIRARYNFTP